MDRKRLEAYEDVEFFRRKYLQETLRIPRDVLGDPKSGKELWIKANRLQKVYTNSAKSGKLPELLAESVYRNLATRIRKFLGIWDHLRQVNDPELSEQARTRLRKAFEALYFPLHNRQKLNILTLWDEFILEKIMVENVRNLLRELATPLGTIPMRDEKLIAAQWNLTREDVREIWQQRKNWRPYVRERLTRRYNVSIERLNRLIPISRRANFASMKKLGAGQQAVKSIADSLLSDEILKALSK